jgi:hypothetical protein
MNLCGRTRTSLLLLILASLLLGSSIARAGDGSWSRYAMEIPTRRPFAVPSPDRKRTIRINEMVLTVVEDGMPVEGAERIEILLPSEIVWSPDSLSFALTSSDGGANGTWEVGMFLLQNSRFRYSDVSREAVDLYQKEFPCTSPQEPNVGAVKFVKESKQLLLVVDPPLTSSCGDQVAIRGFVVTVPDGKVVKEIAGQDLRDDWGEALGPRFGRRLR